LSAGHNPTVSIGLPVYNAERYLSQTLDSILGQTFTDFELIISDNASSDGTEAICRQYASRDSRIAYYRSPKNVGLTGNFNRVFNLSSGRYFRWSSSDDLFAPTSIEECVHILDRYPDVALCYPKTTLINAEGNVIGFYADNLDVRFPDAVRRFRHVHLHLGLANVQYGLIRRDALGRTSLFGAYAGSDMVLIAELSLYGKFWEIPQYLFFRRMHNRAASALRETSPESVQECWDSASKDKLCLYHWTHRLYEVKSICRSPRRIWDKIQLICFLIGYTFRARNNHLDELLSVGPQMVRKLRRTLAAHRGF